MEKKYNKVLVGLMVFLLVVSMSNVIQAADGDEKDIEKRMELIKASKKLEEKKKETPSTEYVMFLTDYGTGSGESNLGVKLEIRYPQKDFKNVNSSKWKYVIEGIYIKDESTAVGFISLQRMFTNLKFNPYFGGGLELTGRAKYQLFTGLNLTRNFFIETKYINEEGSFTDSKFYSVAGYQIDF